MWLYKASRLVKVNGSIAWITLVFWYILVNACRHMYDNINSLIIEYMGIIWKCTTVPYQIVDHHN